MEIIDAHIHSLPCGIMCGGSVDVTYEKVIEGMEQHGIKRGIFVPINDISWQPVDEMNDYMVKVINRNKNIVGFADIDISKIHFYNGIIDLENNIKRLVKLGLKGIKVHPQNLGVNGDDWRLMPIYRLAGELNIPVMIHCHPGSCPGTIDNSNPKYIEKMVRVFHKTKFIISHFGGVLYFDYMPWLNHENVYFECSGILESLKKHYSMEKIRAIFEEIGYEKMFFGSDFPVVDLNAQIEIFKDLVPEEFHEDVFSKNILKFGEEFEWWK